MYLMVNALIKMGEMMTYLDIQNGRKVLELIEMFIVHLDILHHRVN